MVLRSWEKPSADTPAGTFRFREHALLWAAALEVSSRGSDLGIGVRRDQYGQVIEEWLPEKGSRRLAASRRISRKVSDVREFLRL